MSEVIGREILAFAGEHRAHRIDQAIDRNLFGPAWQPNYIVYTHPPVARYIRRWRTDMILMIRIVLGRSSPFGFAFSPLTPVVPARPSDSR